jgi:hypothetical protein
MATKRSVVQVGCPIVNEDGAATETIKPGYLVKGISDIAKQTGTGFVPKAVALERDELGAGIDDTRQGSGTVSADYASGDYVKVGVFKSGERAVGYVASGENISEDELLESAGDGTYASGSTNPIARAVESTGGAVTVETAIVVEFL